MKRIIAIFLVLSLLIVSASAAGVYDVEEDTVILKSPVSVMSADSGIALAEFTGDDSNYLRLIYENILNLNTHLSSRFDVYLSKVFDIKLSELDNTLTLIYSRLADTNTAIGTVNSWLNSINISLVSVDSWLEDIYGSVATENTLSAISGKVSTDETLIEVHDSVVDVKDAVNTQFNSLVLPAGSVIMGPDGTIVNSWEDWSLETVMQYGLIGIQRLFSGYSDNTYSGVVYNNNLDQSAFTTNGLGHLLGSYLSPLQLNVAQLAYMFANPTDLEAKKDSESATKSVTDNFLDPESDASIKLSDVGILKDSSKTVQQLGDTGVSPDQAFSQLTGNSDLFAFFSQETASDLDTTVMALNDDPDQQIVTTYYEDSRAAFYELIGKGGR